MSVKIGEGVMAPYSFETLNRFRQNLKQMITSATRPLVPNLVLCVPRMGEIVTLLSVLFDVLLTCPDSIVRRRNVVNDS